MFLILKIRLIVHGFIVHSSGDKMSKIGIFLILSLAVASMCIFTVNAEKQPAKEVELLSEGQSIKSHGVRS